MSVPTAGGRRLSAWWVPSRRRAGAGAERYELPEAGHTGGLRARPTEYERRTTQFLDRALGL